MRPCRAKGARGSEEKEWKPGKGAEQGEEESQISPAERPPGARPASTTHAKSLERRTSRKLEAMKCSQVKQLGRAAKSSQEQLAGRNERHP
ncbi:hypothetical protein HaLaN_21952 [Haematococcus lacustris]|uniref:Uncharacterized protein n=1 Tax=Haematococcus lacustris TaxID=44745 RepID=A0A699ZQL0_HAELA|nr:hypothetical protein HaLaN_21952 [Haematococcus lacustris]